MTILFQNWPFLIECAACLLFMLAWAELWFASGDRALTLLTCAAYGWLLEELNILLFGTYHYPQVYILRLGAVPIWIPLVWSLILHSAMAISNRFPVARYCRPLMDGLLVLLLDLAIDAVAIRLHLWHWSVPRENNRPLGLHEGWFGVPAGNLTGWMWVATSYSLFKRLLYVRHAPLFRMLLSEFVIVPLAYAGLIIGILLTGFVTAVFGATVEGDKLWVLGAQVTIFVACCYTWYGADRPLEAVDSEVSFVFSAVRWGAHCAALGGIIIGRMWKDSPGLLWVALGTIGIEMWLLMLLKHNTVPHRVIPGQHPPRVSVIIPAFNEERYLPATLEALRKSCELWTSKTGDTVEIIVVDNSSTDKTAAIVAASGVRLVNEAQRNVACVRNKGARMARGDVFVFLDADTIVPELLITRVCVAFGNSAVLGGAVDTLYRPRRVILRLYLELWRLFARLTHMAQGATQFIRRESFIALNGYDERLFMGEDVDFFWRLKRLANQRACGVQLIRDLRVIPSTRRFDRWPLWRTLFWTNPLVVAVCQHSPSTWRGWYSNTPR
jgi:hypothetical protein